MTQNSQALHRNRCFTKQFLLSQTDSDIQDEGLMSDKGVSSCFSMTYGLNKLSKVFPDILAGRSFTEAAMTRLNASSKFGAMAVRIDSFPIPGHLSWDSDPKAALETREDVEKCVTEILLDVARAIDSLSGPSGGMWGMVTQEIFGCFFPEKDETLCLEFADRIQKNFADRRKETVTIGIALYPLIHFRKRQILENACKALDHAAFSGPGSTAVFDAVTLNISGDKLYQKGEIHEAIEEFRRAILVDPSNVNVHNSLGVCYGVLGLYEKAFESFKSAIRLDSKEVMAIYNAGLVNLLIGNKAKALKFFLLAGNIGEDIFEVAFQSGRLYLEAGKPGHGKMFFEKATQIRPDSGAAFRYLGECYVALKMPDKAIQAYKSAIKQNPNDAAALSALGYLFDIQGESLEVAAVFCQHSVAISPENGLFRYRLGRVYLKQKRLEDALEEFVKANDLGHNTMRIIEKLQTSLTVRAS